MRNLKKLQLVLVGILVAGAGFPALAQEKEDRVVARDGDLVIYRTEDGKVKITREGVDEDEWVVVVDPDRKSPMVMHNRDIDREYEFRVPAPPAPGVEMDWEGAWSGPIEREDIIVRMKDAEDLADRIRSRVMIDSGPLALWHERSIADRQVAEMESEAARLAREWRKAEGEERTQLETELEEKLEAIFEAKEEARKEDVARMNERIQDLESRIAERQRHKEEIIARRKSRLLGENDPLAW